MNVDVSCEMPLFKSSAIAIASGGQFAAAVLQSKISNYSFSVYIILIKKYSPQCLRTAVRKYFAFCVRFAERLDVSLLMQF